MCTNKLFAQIDPTLIFILMDNSPYVQHIYSCSQIKAWTFYVYNNYQIKLLKKLEILIVNFQNMGEINTPTKKENFLLEILRNHFGINMPWWFDF